MASKNSEITNQPRMLPKLVNCWNSESRSWKRMPKNKTPRLKDILANVQARFNSVQSNYKKTHITDFEMQVLCLQEINCKLGCVIPAPIKATKTTTNFSQTEDFPEHIPVQDVTCSIPVQTDNRLTGTGSVQVQQPGKRAKTSFHKVATRFGSWTAAQQGLWTKKLPSAVIQLQETERCLELLGFGGPSVPRHLSNSGSIIIKTNESSYGTRSVRRQQNSQSVSDYFNSPVKYSSRNSRRQHQPSPFFPWSSLHK
ncbi:uncharacterized protein LOC129749843 [Uranotaenia lowii]|uniref:uncharacterized protein LOC129749843 n=1 Tax=Uranotaenia lowii TaxID=190385 RepID=UPI0024784622|nr:uncharacterized protein LOC129749843 [Uranotaenia lowii]